MFGSAGVGRDGIIARFCGSGIKKECGGVDRKGWPGHTVNIGKKLHVRSALRKEN